MQGQQVIQAWKKDRKEFESRYPNSWGRRLGRTTKAILEALVSPEKRCCFVTPNQGMAIYAREAFIDILQKLDVPFVVSNFEIIINPFGEKSFDKKIQILNADRYGSDKGLKPSFVIIDEF